MTRHRLALLILLVVAAACTYNVSTAAAHNYGDCAWSEHGETLQFPDGTYKCICARQLGPQGKYDVWCSWRRQTTASRKHAWHLSITHPIPGVVA